MAKPQGKNKSVTISGKKVLIEKLMDRFTELRTLAERQLSYEAPTYYLTSRREEMEMKARQQASNLISELDRISYDRMSSYIDRMLVIPPDPTDNMLDNMLTQIAHTD